MRTISNEELQAVAGGEDVVQTVTITGTKMTDSEKAEFDNQLTYVANGIDSCALGDVPACLSFVFWSWKSPYVVENYIDWNLFGN